MRPVNFSKGIPIPGTIKGAKQSLVQQIPFETMGVGLSVRVMKLQNGVTPTPAKLEKIKEEVEAVLQTKGLMKFEFVIHHRPTTHRNEVRLWRTK